MNCKRYKKYAREEEKTEDFESERLQYFMLVNFRLDLHILYKVGDENILNSNQIWLKTACNVKRSTPSK